MHDGGDEQDRREGVRLRTLLLLPVAVALAVVLCSVGVWQWRLAVQTAAATLPDDPASPVTTLAPPGQLLDPGVLARRVTVSGTYDAGRTLLVTGRRLDGTDGAWVLVPMRTPDGTVVPVVRGFLPTAATTAAATAAAEGAAAEAPSAPPGSVEVAGRLQAPFTGAPGGSASGSPTVTGIDPADLVNRWGGPIVPAYVVAEQETPAAPTALTRVPADPPGVGTSVQLRNLAYALQWFLFAGFVALLWQRLARDDRAVGGVRVARDASPRPVAPVPSAPPPAVPPQTVPRPRTREVP